MEETTYLKIVIIILTISLSFFAGKYLHNYEEKPIELSCPEPLPFDYKKCPVITKTEPIENCYERVLEDKQNVDTMSEVFKE